MGAVPQVPARHLRSCRFISRCVLLARGTAPTEPVPEVDPGQSFFAVPDSAHRLVAAPLDIQIERFVGAFFPWPGRGVGLTQVAHLGQDERFSDPLLPLDESSSFDAELDVSLPLVPAVLDPPPPPPHEDRLNINNIANNAMLNFAITEKEFGIQFLVFISSSFIFKIF